MITVINGVTSKQVLANKLISILNTMELDGYFYLGYPVLGGMDGKIKVDALLVCRQCGVVIFDLEMSADDDIEHKIVLLDELYNNMEARLKRYSYLSNRRKLQVPINVISYAPRCRVETEDILISEEAVREYLAALSWDESNDYYTRLLEAIQMISQIKKRGNRLNLQKDFSR